MCQVGTAGTALPNLQQVGHDLPNLQQVWFKYAKLAVSMAVQAILGAFLAALGSMIMLVGLLALLCRNLAVAVEIAYQRLSANPQAAVLLSWWFSRDVGNWYQTGCLRVF